MSDIDDVQPEVETEGQGQVETPPAEAPSNGNPAWDSIREKLDVVSFKLIEDELKGFDQSAQKRIESVNEQFKWAKQLSDQGINPEAVNASLALYQRVQTEPEAVYEILHTFLKENGRLPSDEEVAEKLEEADSEDEDQRINDPRLDKMDKFIEAQTQREQQIQLQQMQVQADQQIQNEVKQIREAHPEYTDKDLQMLFKLASAETTLRQASRNYQPYTLADANTAYQEMRETISAIPRAGASAPKLVPTSGSIPSGQQGKPIGQLSNQETQDLVADYLTRAGQS